MFACICCTFVLNSLWIMKFFIFDYDIINYLCAYLIISQAPSKRQNQKTNHESLLHEYEEYKCEERTTSYSLQLSF
jgi:hypothetical protein